MEKLLTNRSEYEECEEIGISPTTMTMIISGTFVKEESNKSMASLFSSILEKCVLAIVGVPVHLVRSCDYEIIIPIYI